MVRASLQTVTRDSESSYCDFFYFWAVVPKSVLKIYTINGRMYEFRTSDGLQWETVDVVTTMSGVTREMVQIFAEITGNSIPAGNVADYVFGPRPATMKTARTEPRIVPSPPPVAKISQDWVDVLTLTRHLQQRC